MMHVIVDIMGYAAIMLVLAFANVCATEHIQRLWKRHRSRRAEAITPPADGLIHFHDGAIRPVYAESPGQAVKRLIASSQPAPKWVFKGNGYGLSDWRNWE